MRIYEVMIRIEADDDCLPEHIDRELHDGLHDASFSFYTPRINEEGVALARARQKVRSMFAGLMPGNTGNNIADEVANKIVAAYLGTEETHS